MANFWKKQLFVGGLGLFVSEVGGVTHLIAAIYFTVLCVVAQAVAMPYGDSTVRARAHA